MAGSLYIHIPFCRRKCVYCDFYSVIYDDALAAAYVDTLINQIKGLAQEKFSTIYIGGGTPTALDKILLKRLLDSLRDRMNADCEFTIEANPESLNDDKTALLLDSGVNRLSVGVQSIDDRKLKRLGRIHDARKAIDIVALARKKGFKNISADLIFGVWNEGLSDWKKELADIVKLPLTHISCYGLTYEKDTPLYMSVKNGSVHPLEDEEAAEMYEEAIDLLSLRDFKQYEVSNFARIGYECRHNLSYWENNPYIGLGPSAASYIDGVRSKNVTCVKEYLKRIGEGKSPVESSEKLPPLRRARETAAVKIRTRDGIDFARFKEKTGFGFCELEKKALKELIDKGLIKYKKEGSVTTGVCLKRKGFLFCDTVSAAFL